MALCRAPAPSVDDQSKAPSTSPTITSKRRLFEIEICICALLPERYLFDVEFYRAHGKTFSGFQWRYYHLGPWTGEFDPLLDQLVSRGEITENIFERTDYDAKFLRSNSPANLKTPFDNYKDEAVLKVLLDTWGPRSTGEILDFVYFRTEPMENGTRSENLDFSGVLPQAPHAYKRAASKKTSGEIMRLRREFSQKIAKREPSPTFQFTEPKYDEEFHAAIEKLDSGEL